MNLTHPYIKNFLDSVDIVLNSNTFLLETSADFENQTLTSQDIKRFIHSDKFKNALIEQDLLRGWGNYHTIDLEGNYVADAERELVKPNAEVILHELPQKDASIYLRTMLTIEHKNYAFWSPYHKQFGIHQAKLIVAQFIAILSANQSWKLYMMNTDFCYNQTEVSEQNNLMAYFEGAYASDSATLMIREDQKAYLLLTNGID